MEQHSLIAKHLTLNGRDLTIEGLTEAARDPRVKVVCDYQIPTETRRAWQECMAMAA